MDAARNLTPPRNLSRILKASALAPRELYVEHNATGLKSMEIIDDAGQRQIVKLRDPIMLPPP